MARRTARAGLVPGPESFLAYAVGLDGKPGGTPVTFTLTALEPAPGTEVPLVGADPGNSPLTAGRFGPGRVPRSLRPTRRLPPTAASTCPRRARWCSSGPTAAWFFWLERRGCGRQRR